MLKTALFADTFGAEGGEGARGSSLTTLVDTFLFPGMRGVINDYRHRGKRDADSNEKAMSGGCFVAERVCSAARMPPGGATLSSLRCGVDRCCFTFVQLQQLLGSERTRVALPEDFAVLHGVGRGNAAQFQCCCKTVTRVNGNGIGGRNALLCKELFQFFGRFPIANVEPDNPDLVRLHLLPKLFQVWNRGNAGSAPSGPAFNEPEFISRPRLRRGATNPDLGENFFGNGITDRRHQRKGECEQDCKC